MKTTLFLFICIFPAMLFAQGCSDAGFCSIGNLGMHNTHKASRKQSLQLSLPVGVGDENVFVFTPALEYLRQLNTRWQLQGKITANYASGNLGNAFGPGDVYLSGTYLLNPNKPWQTSVTLGTKLPLNQSDLKRNGLSLPMQYQSSLGTVDAIVGLSVSSARWQFAAGYQQPLSGINLNHFLPIYYDSREAMAYPPTNDFNRRGDVLLRSTYAVTQKSKWQLNLGLLGIYHLGNDTYIDAGLSNKPIPIKGSDGLTLNATGFFKYAINPSFDFGLTGGIPLVIRDVRPDGLTRSFVFAPQINYHF